MNVTYHTNVRYLIYKISNPVDAFCDKKGALVILCAYLHWENITQCKEITYIHTYIHTYTLHSTYRCA